MIKRELVLFSIVGSMTVLIDFVTYSLASSTWVGVDSAKAGGFLAGTVFAYTANRFWTFGHTAYRPGSAWRFGALYLVTLGTNVMINASVLQFLAGARAAVQLAFLVATAVSAAMNFLGMKLFVFKVSSGAESK